MTFQKGNTIWVGRHHTKETIEKMRDKRMSEESKHKMRLAKSYDKNPMWKGDEVGYQGLHDWVRRHFIKPDLCEICRIESGYDWSCIGGYNRERKNWKYACRSCHMFYDYKQGIRHGKGNGDHDDICRGK